jgi:hypothetical protein
LGGSRGQGWWLVAKDQRPHLVRGCLLFRVQIQPPRPMPVEPKGVPRPRGGFCPSVHSSAALPREGSRSSAESAQDVGGRAARLVLKSLVRTVGDGRSTNTEGKWRSHLTSSAHASWNLAHVELETDDFLRRAGYLGR